MAPYFNVEPGEQRDPDLYTDTPDPIALSSDAPKPVAPKDGGSDAPPIKPHWPELKTAAQLETFRAEWLGNPWHPAHGDPGLRDHYARAQWLLEGRPLDAEGQPIDPETGSRGELEIHGGDRVFARVPGDAAEGTYAESATLAADRPEQDAFMTLGRDLGAPEFADDVRHGMLRILERPVLSDVEMAQQYGAQWTPAEQRRINEQLDELHEVTDRWLAQHGVSEARRDRWTRDLDRVEDRGKVGIDWLLNELWAGLWQRDPGGFSITYAEWAGGQYEAGRARAAKARRDEAAEGDEARAAATTEVAATHQRWRRSAP